MDILNGLLFINDVDVYQSFGAFLSEENPGEYRNYNSLLTPSKAKPHIAVNFRERDGEKYPQRLTPALEARDVILYFTIEAADKLSFLRRYSDFVLMLKNGADGWLSIRVPELDRTYRMFYLECTEYKQLTPFEGAVYASFAVKLREPEPQI